MAAEFGVPVAAAAVVVSGHLLAYGAGQLPWAALTQRWGAVRALRASLCGAGVFAGAAAAAPSVQWLVASRAVGGLFIAAAVPAALLYVGTYVRADEQHRGFSAIVAANGVGIVLATGVAAVAVATEQWRAAYAVVGLLLVGCSLAVGALNKPRRGAPAVAHEGRRAAPGGGDDAARDGPVNTVHGVVRANRLQHVVGAPPVDVVRPAVLVFVEGATVIGAVMVLPVLAAAAALPPAIGWISVAVYGLAMPISSRALTHRRTVGVGLPVRTALGCAVLVAAGAVLWLAPALAAVLVTAALLGACWSAVHPTLQESAAQAWPRRRAYALGVFVTALFAGSAAGTQAFAFAAAGGASVTALALLLGALALLIAERLTRREP